MMEIRLYAFNRRNGPSADLPKVDRYSDPQAKPADLPV
jgi:hypothetical protein